MQTIDQILSRFPKKRLALSPEMEALHLDVLVANRERQTWLSKISNLLESWMHRQVADRGRAVPATRLLEIGAGTMNHVDFEPASICYDAVEPIEELYKGKDVLARLANLYNDAKSIPEDTKYERIVSVATLEHLTELPFQVATSGLRLAEGGVFQVGIPCEGGFLWGFSWRISTAVAFRLKTGFNFADHMKYEHVNDAREIREVLSYFFREITVKRFPLPLFHLSLYEYIEARLPNAQRCRDYLESAKQNKNADAQ
jgi:hypothetical protein